jgi:hypothetical protein
MTSIYTLEKKHARNLCRKWQAKEKSTLGSTHTRHRSRDRSLHFRATYIKQSPYIFHLCSTLKQNEAGYKTNDGIAETHMRTLNERQLSSKQRNMCLRILSTQIFSLFSCRKRRAYNEKCWTDIRKIKLGTFEIQTFSNKIPSKLQ